MKGCRQTVAALSEKKRFHMRKKFYSRPFQNARRCYNFRFAVRGGFTLHTLPHIDCIRYDVKVNSMEPSSGMRQFLLYHRRMVVVMTAVSAAVWLVVRLTFRDGGLSTGFLIGAAAQLLKFGFLDVAVVRKIAIEKKNAAATQLKTGAVTLLLFAAAALFVIKNSLSVWAMAAGIFLPRLILIADTYIRPNPFGNGSDEPDRDESADAPADNDGDATNFGSDDGRAAVDDAPVGDGINAAHLPEEEDGSTGTDDRDRPPLEERRDS